MKKGKNLYIISALIILISVFVIILLNYNSNAYNTESDNMSIKLKSDWQYFNDDSQANEDIVKGLKDANDKDKWVATTTEDFNVVLRDYDKNNSKWLRVKLPEIKLKEPVLLFDSFGYNFDVYYNNKEIYNFGEVKPPFERKVGLFRHSIKLENYQKDKYVYFKVHPHFKIPYGKTGLFTNFELNSRDGYLNKIIFKKGSDITFFACTFIIIGIISMFVCVLTNLKEKMSLAFGIFLLCYGLCAIAFDQTIYSFYIHPFILYYMMFFSYYLMAVGICLFIIFTFKECRNKIFYLLTIGFAFHSVLMLLLDIFNIAPISLTDVAFEISLMVVLIYIIFVITRLALKGDTEAKILTFTITMASILGMFDIFRALSDIGWERENDFIYYHQWGFIIVVFAVEYIIVRRYVNSHESLKKYSQSIEQWNRILEKRVEKRTEELTKLNSELVVANQQLKQHASMAEELAIEKERNRFARDAHDTLGQTMTLLTTLLQVSLLEMNKDPGKAKEKLSRALVVAKDGLDGVKRSIVGLAQQNLEAKSLVGALEELIAEFKSSGAKIELFVEGEESKLDDVYLDGIYRTCQEALTNSLRHGKATHVTIRIVFAKEVIKLSIVDNGCGCPNISIGFGLRGMENRIKNLNGTISYGTDGDSGFCINVEIPLK